jgi:flagellar hook-basal body complex protein FliE
MTIDAISPLAAPAVQSPLELQTATAPELASIDLPTADGLSFDGLVSGIQELNDKLVAGSEAAHALALGQVDNLHQVMMAGTETKLAFDLMLQVRGKVLDAYQELLRMQV